MDTKSLAKAITKRLIDEYFLALPEFDAAAVQNLIEEELERGEYKESE